MCAKNGSSYLCVCVRACCTGLQGADLSGAALDLDALSRDLNRLRSQPVLDHLQLLERQLGLRLASVSTYVK